MGIAVIDGDFQLCVVFKVMEKRLLKNWVNVFLFLECQTNLERVKKFLKKFSRRAVNRIDSPYRMPR